MYDSHEKRVRGIIMKTWHNVILKRKSHIKKFNFDDKLKINICVTENNKEKDILSYICSSYD